MEENLQLHRLRTRLAESGLDETSTLGLLDELRPLLLDRLYRLQDPTVLDEIVRNDIWSIRHTPVTERSHGIRAGLLGHLCRSMEEETGRSSDLAKAVYFGRYACAVMPQHTERASMANATTLLICSLAVYSQRKNSRASCEEALVLAMDVASIGTPDRDKQSERLAHLGAIYQQRYVFSRNRQDLEESVRYGVEAIVLASQREKILSQAQNLGLSLSQRYLLSGDFNDLTNAIHYTEITLKRSNLSSRTKSDCLNNLAIFLTYRWRVTEADKDLIDAIDVQNRAITALKSGHPRRAYLLARITGLLLNAYYLTSRLHYINDAIHASLEALKINQIDEPKHHLLNNLGTQLLQRFRRTKHPSDLDLAIQYFTQALGIAPAQSTRERSIIMTNLSNAFQDRFASRLLQTDLKKSLKLVEAAHSELPDSISYNSWLSATNIQLQYFRLSKDSQYLDSALNKLQSTLAALTEEDIVNGKYSFFFAGGNIFLELHELHKSQEAMDMALAYYLACWEAVVATPIMRISAARKAARLFLAADNPVEAWTLLKKAVDLVPIVCHSSLNRKEQQVTMSELSGLSNEACSAALAAGVEPLDALEVLERGRGVIIASTHSAASQLEDLEAKAPELFQEYQILWTKINVHIEPLEEIRLKNNEAEHPLHIEQQFQDIFGGVTDREQRISDLEYIIKRIQKEVAGLSDFMAPLSTYRIHCLAKEGPIVTLVAGHTRADAILLSSSGAEVLPLTHLLPDAPQVFLRKCAIVMTNLVFKSTQHISTRNSVLTGLLCALWKMICGPICQALRLDPRKKDTPGLPPRTWWIGTGLFARLPLHAAGVFVIGEPGNSMIARTTPSYIASFRMLEWARSQSWNVGRVGMRGILLSMLKAPENLVTNTIIGNSQEIKNDRALFIRTAVEEKIAVLREGQIIQWQIKERPSAQTVLQDLPKYSVLHACCHGISDPEDPANSHLKLYSRKINTLANDPANMDPLTVSLISQRRSKNAVLAYLSACSTADVRAHHLLDEGFQIGNAFQLAGFPHVIATLWPAAEHVCPTVARWFYHFLTSFTIEEPLTNLHIALALQCAVGKAMNENRRLPILWATFIHQGA